ncbi:MAG: hypothetical protein HOM08_11875 [Candidatus Marinimicrobia bacterium]|nr:hypothetical protein [Candidatus Neomarinimicrobiota bacterium]MBT5538560.1 hypothetical protein [Candidatus Neomarinimicrobiota bacterium]
MRISPGIIPTFKYREWFKTILLISIGITSLFSQPGWTYNPNDFADTGSITSIVQINDTQVGGPGDILGAFSEDVCRGIANSISTPNGYYFFLSVGGTFDDIITFQYYDSATDITYPIVETVVFSPNMELGIYGTPYIFNSSSELIQDCNGVYGGSAFIDNCGVCSDGNTGHDPDSDMDCMDICFGPNLMDDFGECCDQFSTWYDDSDGDGLGTELIFIESCSIQPGYVGNSDDLYPDCFSNLVDCMGTCDGLFIEDQFGSCCESLLTWYEDFDGDGLGDPNQTIEACSQPLGHIDNDDDLYPDCFSNIIDCLGVCDGNAVEDICGDCNGDSSSCADCQGIPFGSAEFDDCGVCSGGFTGHDFNSDMDCNGECFGAGIIDPDQVCCYEADMDCAGYCDGTHGDIQWAGYQYYSPDGVDEPWDFQEVSIFAKSFPIIDVSAFVRVSTDGWQTFQDYPMTGETGPSWPDSINFSVSLGIFPAGTEIEYNIQFSSCNEWLLDNDGNYYLVMVNDSDLDDDGLVNWEDPFPECAVNFLDCNEVCGGEAEVDICGYCTGGDTGLLPEFADVGCGCDNPEAQDYCQDLDGDGLGSGQPQSFCSADVPDGFISDCSDEDDECISNIYDCNGDCSGLAIVDDCGICSGGNSGHIENSDMDCQDVCFGPAQVDNCGMCSGGTTGHLADEDIDCYGDCFGDAFEDFCGVCSGGNSGHEANSDIDSCGECFGNDASQDCSGECFGSANIDNCGICAGGNTGIIPDADLDDCNVCNGNNLDQDCNGDCFGDALLDTCGTCTGGLTGLDVNYQMDCAEVCFGSAGLDDCNTCSGGTTGIEFNEDMDCNEVCFGTANLDDCDICAGGDTGLIPDADIDVCGVCFGDGFSIWYADPDGDGYGDPDDFVESCSIPDGYVDNSDDIYPDCFDNFYDIFNICGGNNSIQGAIDVLEPGQTILVPAGTYNEHLTIDRPLTLIGDGSPILQSGNVSALITIASDDVVIQDMVLNAETNTGIIIEIISGYQRIDINNNSISSIDQLTIESGYYIKGINIGGSNTNPSENAFVIQGNNFENINLGITINSQTQNAIISGNTIHDLVAPNPAYFNSEYPIGMQIINSSEIQLNQNQFLNIGMGIFMFFSTGTASLNEFENVEIFLIHDETNIFEFNDLPDHALVDIQLPDLPALIGHFANLNNAFLWAQDGTTVYWVDDIGQTPYIQDCFDEWGGSANIDQCGYCTGGNTGLEPEYADLGCGCDEPAPQLYCIDNDGDGLGSGEPQLICQADLSDIYVSDCSDEDDACAGDIYDCAGICNGLSVIDDCDVCNLPDDFNSSMDDCQVCFGNNLDMDCNNDCFGTAIIDDCGICSDGETGLDPNADRDCAGECFGSNVIDDCDDCVLSDNFNDSMDCAGICDGLAYIDECNTCDDIPDNDCIMDCNDEWGGSANIDQCGYCTGGNTGLEPEYADLGCGCDEPAPLVYYLDFDLDGYGSQESDLFCLDTNPVNWVSNSNDCEDLLFDVNPDAVEICDDIDNNCDDQTDEGCLIGDVNDDGELNVSDLVYMIGLILTGADVSDYELWSADVSQDGIINVIDVIELVALILSDNLILSR